MLKHLKTRYKIRSCGGQVYKDLKYGIKLVYTGLFLSWIPLAAVLFAVNTHSGRLTCYLGSLFFLASTAFYWLILLAGVKQISATPKIITIEEDSVSGYEITLAKLARIPGTPPPPKKSNRQQRNKAINAIKIDLYLACPALILFTVLNIIFRPSFP